MGKVEQGDPCRLERKVARKRPFGHGDIAVIYIALSSASFPRTRESSSYGPVQRDIDPYVYLLASSRNGTLYVGVTSNLMQRVAQHRVGTFGGFTAKHEVHRLVWFEQHATMEHAIIREKQIKKWRRVWKLDLIEQINPD